ncbi:MAG: nicotinate phosphoribosyltransferase [Candidatus Bathyarchaeia archaeon]
MGVAAMDVALNTDLYELTMAQSYLESGKLGDAVFSLFIRRMPRERGFLVSAGLETLLEALRRFRFSEEEINYLGSLGRFSDEFLDYLKDYSFTGDLYAVPEGRIIFENEPLIQVEASLPDAQIIETMVINVIHFQTVVASKAARSLLAAQGRRVVDFGLRRAHGLEAGLYAARAAYIAGFHGTSNLEAGRRFGIPVVGTMAHSYVMVFDSEEEAFRSFAKSFPENSIFLIDTYDTIKAAEKVVELAKAGVPVIGVRIDSGDLAALSKRVRCILDDAGLRDVKIIVSGGLDEYDIRELMNEGAPVDVFAVGTKVVTSSDRPYLDIAYKLVEYKGEPKFKLSPGKATFPYKRQIYRYYSREGVMEYDEVVKYDGEGDGGEAMVAQILKGGRQIYNPPRLEDLRENFMRDAEALPENLKRLEYAPYRVIVK